MDKGFGVQSRVHFSKLYSYWYKWDRVSGCLELNLVLLVPVCAVDVPWATLPPSHQSKPHELNDLEVLFSDPAVWRKADHIINHWLPWWWVREVEKLENNLGLDLGRKWKISTEEYSGSSFVVHEKNIIPKPCLWRGIQDYKCKLWIIKVNY
jgi:hypothetical protein